MLHIDYFSLLADRLLNLQLSRAIRQQKLASHVRQQTLSIIVSIFDSAPRRITLQYEIIFKFKVNIRKRNNVPLTLMGSLNVNILTLIYESVTMCELFSNLESQLQRSNEVLERIADEALDSRYHMQVLSLSFSICSLILDSMVIETLDYNSNIQRPGLLPHNLNLSLPTPTV